MKLSYENAYKASVRAGTFRCFDPVRDYLDGLEWDGEERLTWWLETYFGAGVDESDDEEAQVEERTWNQQIGKRWMISAVARVYDPGCQVDTILIAEGPQGIGKSSAFRALAVQDASGSRATCLTSNTRTPSIMCLGRGSSSFPSWMR